VLVLRRARERRIAHELRPVYAWDRNQRRPTAPATAEDVKAAWAQVRAASTPELRDIFAGVFGRLLEEWLQS
jgi:hypothetical protein